MHCLLYNASTLYLLILILTKSLVLQRKGGINFQTVYKRMFENLRKESKQHRPYKNIGNLK